MAEPDLLIAALDTRGEPWVLWGPQGRIVAASRLLSPLAGPRGPGMLGADEPAFAALLATWSAGQNLERRAHPLPGGGRLELLHDLEADRRDASRREELLGIAIHDLRAPLANVRSYAGLLLSGKLPELEPRVRRSAEVIARNSDRALRLLQMFFDSQRIDTGELDIDRSPVPLGPLLEELVSARRAQAAEKGVEMTLRAPADVPSVSGDRERLASAVGAMLDLAAARSPSARAVELTCEPLPGQLRIEVADSGPQLSEQELRDAFDRDAQALRERRLGVGFACAVAGAIAKVHGGDAGVRSTPQRTVHWLALPL